MTAQAAAWGRLGQNPKSIDTKSGKPMTIASIAVEVGEDETLWLGIVAFGDLAEKLEKHSKGECISVSGRLQRNRYTDRNGVNQEQLQVVADSLVSSRTVRPDGRKKQKKTEPQDPEPFNDPITF